jgi:hypothetical protein
MMSSQGNLLLLIILVTNIVSILFLAYKFYQAKNPTFKLFAIGLALFGAVEICYLGVSMLWTVPLIDFRSAQYLFYIYAILVMFAASASVLRTRTRYFINIFLAFFAIIVTGLYLINNNFEGATIYEIRYFLSFENAATVNIFSLILALSFGMATLIVGQRIKDKLHQTVIEAGFLIVIACQVVSLLSYGDTIRFVASLLGFISLLAMALFFIKYDTSKQIGLVK